MSLLAGNLGATGTEDGPVGVGTLNGPANLARGTDGSVYIVDSSLFNGTTIRKLDATGQLRLLAGPRVELGSFYRDGSAETARFSEDLSAAVGGDGLLYLAESNANVIRRVAANGSTTTVAGKADEVALIDGAASSARLGYPSALTTAADGSLYFRDIGVNGTVIRRLTMDGAVSTVVAAGSFDGVRSMSVAADGTLYAIDKTGLRKRTPSGQVQTLVPVPASTEKYPLYYPGQVVVDSAGVVWLTQSNSISRVGVDGQLVAVAGKEEESGWVDGNGAAARFNVIAGMASDGKGGVYVSDKGNAVIRHVSAAGAVTTVAGWAMVRGTVDGLGAAAQFKGTGNIVAECSGNFIWSWDALRRITPAGQVSTLVSHNGFAQGLTLDQSGNAYFADPQANSMRKQALSGAATAIAVQGTPMATGTDGSVYYEHQEVISRLSPDGKVSFIAGRGNVVPLSQDGSGSAASFANITGMVLDAAGNIYVVDSGYGYKFLHVNAGAIRKVTPAGVVTTLAGGGAVGLVDGAGSAARFFNPTGIDIDSAGNLYVADTGNHAIRKVTPAGVVTTIAGNGRKGFVGGPLTGPIPSPAYLAVSGNSMAVTTRQGVILIKGF
jgi:sugar lactone lactonase YvrE